MLERSIQHSYPSRKCKLKLQDIPYDIIRMAVRKQMAMLVGKDVNKEVLRHCSWECKLHNYYRCPYGWFSKTKTENRISI